MKMEVQPIAEASDILSQVDIILPAQYFGALGSVGLSSEQRLMLAVLVDAINVLQGWQRIGNPRKRRAFAEAAQWVNTCGTNHPFSFDSICDAIAIDPDLLRTRLHRLTMGLANTACASMKRLRLKELSRAHRVSTKRKWRKDILKLS
jgi:hypothetical protein